MFGPSLRPLRSRNFALVWSAAFVSNIGTWMQMLALGVLVTARTHNPAWTAAIAAVGFVPMGLLAPVGGVLADRLDRRRWLIVTTLAETACAAGLAVLVGTGHTQPAGLTALAFLAGSASAIGFPAYQAMVPDLVPAEDLLGAVSLSSAQFNMGRVLGPLVAGVFFIGNRYTLAFAVNAASFAAVLVALLLVRIPPPAPRTDQDGPWARVVQCARTAASVPGCRSAVVLISVVALTASPFIALVPAMAQDVLHHGGGGTSVLVAAQGIGAVVGAVALPSLAQRFGRALLLRTALFVLPAFLVAYAAAPTLPLAAVGIGLVGAGYIFVLSGLNTVVQLWAPAAARGRVLSLYMLALGVLYPIGAVIQGAIASAAGLRIVTAGAAVALVVALAAIAGLRPHVLASLADPVRARPEPVDSQRVDLEPVDLEPSAGPVADGSPVAGELGTAP